ncbi:MAG: Asp-tRNA(Asn)/Glu-tRNA(Gln) amidotransferase subunit GatB [Candidatus Levyibacteriota bacterium]|nr:MAG: Asp-tRNA(Asn)/Glu-tRNA(Gln) amidotransferase subunit GatB [Candidatus Levybacteria bacterium]
MKYTPVIGLEIHVELKTKSKMFCGCSADYFGQKPNTHTCPVCLGLPGALPVPNQQAIDWCVMIGMALNCEIPLFSKFDRKNYFYPDLAKGYQISQYDQPFCLKGSIKLSNGKTIGITRVHMEEDTAKLMHEGKDSLVDFNRSGVPLVEIVTEPDFDNAADVKEYLQKLQQIVRYLNVANADMEKGDMRLEPNISLRKEDEKYLPKYKVEVKNINSFRFVEKTIEYEITRQTEILDSGKLPAQETRGWDEKKQITYSQRTKEEANEYRYFPEPDIPPLRWNKSSIRQLAKQMPELPDAKLKRFQKEYDLPIYDAEILTREKSMADYFEECVKVSTLQPKSIANYIINKKINIEEVLPAMLVKQIIQSTQTATVDDESLGKIIDEVISENQKAVEDFKNGKETVIMFLVGQVMKKSKQKLDANIVKTLLIKKLNSYG